MSDGQILQVTHVANTGEIDQAKLALVRSKDVRVRGFAQMMVHDHTQADTNGMILAKKESIERERSTTSEQLASDATSATATLKADPAVEFDKSYVDTQVKEHQAVLDMLDQKLIVNATNHALEIVFGNYEGYRQSLGLSDLTLVPDNTSRASAVPSIQPLLALWPVANGPEILTSSGGPSGIAESFSNPLQHIREDFGTLRVDQVFSPGRYLAAIYTIDDSAALSPTSNPLTYTNVNLREQVVSLSETHVFSPTVVNRVTFGFSRGAFFFDSNTTTDLSGWIHEGQPVGAVVVGGGTTLNGASQITNGGTNAGSNLAAVHNLFTGDDQLTITHGKHLLSFGGWVQRIHGRSSPQSKHRHEDTFPGKRRRRRGTRPWPWAWCHPRNSRTVLPIPYSGRHPENRAG